MSKPLDQQARMRSAALMSELEVAKKSSQPGVLGLLIKVTLVIVFAYLIFTSYMIFDTAGPVFISILFLVALFVPNLYRASKGRWGRGRKEEAKLAEESPQEG